MEFTVSLPEWAQEEVKNIDCIESLEERMRAVIKFSRLNIQNNTGGPFAAGVFEEATGKLVAMGVNRVVPTCCSSAHAEVVAVSLAQTVLKSFDLGAEGMPRHQLVVNWRPCAMCYGAVLWSGMLLLFTVTNPVAHAEQRKSVWSYDPLLVLCDGADVLVHYHHVRVCFHSDTSDRMCVHQQ